MLIGTFCTFSARFCAVTMIASSVAVLGSGCGVAVAGVGGTAGARGAASPPGTGSCVLESGANALVLTARQIAAASGSRRRRSDRFFGFMMRCIASSPSSTLRGEFHELRYLWVCVQHRAERGLERV